MAVKFDLDIGAAQTSFNATVDDDPGILVQASNTLVYSFDIDNTTAADAHLQMFNAAALADVSLGTTTPDYVIHSVANGNARGEFSKPLEFPLGLCIFSTTTSTGSTGAAQAVSLGIA